MVCHLGWGGAQDDQRPGQPGLCRRDEQTGRTAPGTFILGQPRNEGTSSPGDSGADALSDESSTGSQALGSRRMIFPEPGESRQTLLSNV